MKKKSRGLITALAILVIGTGLAWQIYFSEKSQSTDLVTLSESIEKQQQALTQITNILTTYDQQFKQVADHSNQLVLSLKELDAFVRGDSQAWRLMQVQNFLEMAMVQATLLNDTNTAISLLAAADNNLKSIQNPNLLPVRKALQADIQMLANHPVSNAGNIILQLEAMNEQVANLPHKIRLQKEILPEATPPSTSTEQWEQRVQAAWHEVKSLVRIQRHDQPITPYFSKDDIWLINENLSLMLEQASFAAARHQTALYQKELQHAQDWIQQYFDLNDPAVQQVNKTLADLSKLPVATDSELHLTTVDAWANFVKSTQTGRETNP